MTAQKLGKTKTIKVYTTISSSLAALCVLQGCGPGAHESAAPASNNQKICAPAQKTEDVFVEVDPETQDDVIEQGSGSPTLRRRGVTLKMDVLKRAIRSGVGGRIRLGLFEDKQVDVLIEEVRGLTEDHAIVVGHVAGDESSEVTLVLNQGVLVGNIHEEGRDERYEIRYQGDGTHVVRALGADTNEECLTVEPPEGSAATPEWNEENEASIQSAPVVDMLVAYTPAARSKQGGTAAMQALIEMGIADTNRAFDESAVNLQVRLVGTMEVSQNDTSNFSSDLTALRGTSDGRWDEVHSERRRLGADQVTLVGVYSANSGVAGIGYINASSASAFTIVRASAFGQYTFSHELGHNIGLAHTDGLENTAGKFRTIMAYGTTKRIRRYSNPDLPYNGYSTGNSTHNSAKILNTNASRMSGLIPTVVVMPTPVPTPVATPVPTPKPTPTPQATPVATPRPGATPAATPTPSPAPSGTPGADDCVLP